jgi:hypothetical protein
VAQTAVNFTSHQVVSPGASAADARRALKCCIFNGLLEHIRRSAIASKTQTDELERRLRLLRNSQSQLAQEPNGQTSRGDLLNEIEAAETALETHDPILKTTRDHLDYVAHTLANPAGFLSTAVHSLRLSRMGIMIEPGSEEKGFDLSLSEIHVASRKPRIGALVRFPRDELLPRDDFLKKADLFLAI